MKYEVLHGRQEDSFGDDSRQQCRGESCSLWGRGEKRLTVATSSSSSSRWSRTSGSKGVPHGHAMFVFCCHIAVGNTLRCYIIAQSQRRRTFLLEVIEV